MSTDTFKPRKIKGYGYLPDLPDSRDYKFRVSVPQALPSSVDLRQYCPSIYNQLDLGSCVANATAALFQFHEIYQKKAAEWMPSRLFIYWNARYLEGNTDSDAGSTLRDGIRSLAKWGVAPETLWPYDTKKFADKPSDSVFTAAKSEIVTKYERVGQDLPDMRACLAANKPFVLGISVYDSFESDAVAASGIVPMPNVETEEMLGGHAILCVGYDDSKHAILCRNSWGPKWGIQGYFWLPYEYFISRDLTGDTWTIDMVP